MQYLGIIPILYGLYLYILSKQYFVSYGVKELGENMIHYYPEWTQVCYCFQRSDGLQIWTKNGMISINIYENGFGGKGFNFWEKKYISKCIKESKIKKANDLSGYKQSYKQFQN